MLDAQILHRGMAIIINGDHSTSMLPIIEGPVVWVKLAEAPCAVAADHIALDIIHREI